MPSYPFHRLLAFYSHRSPTPDTDTIRLSDSLRGNLALGLDFPVALGIALGRHLFLRNTGFFSLNIHVPSVAWTATPLDGIAVDPDRDYSRAEIMQQARTQKGVLASLDALGVWALAADVRSGLITGADVRSFQQGELLQQIERRRRVGRDQVLPLYRGGPISVAGHSWAVNTFFNVQVYQLSKRAD